MIINFTNCQTFIIYVRWWVISKPSGSNKESPEGLGGGPIYLSKYHIFCIILSVPPLRSKIDPVVQHICIASFSEIKPWP